MIRVDEVICPDCGGDLKFYDKVSRIVRTKNRETKWIKIRRMQCYICKDVHRELPDHLLPYKHYEVEVIFGVVEGFITSETLGYEDYPCEITMKQWQKTLTDFFFPNDEF